MSEINLMQLVQCLDVQSKRALESATQYCLTHKHAEVQIEHWLYMLVAEEIDIYTYLQQIGYPVEHWRVEMLSYLQQLPKDYQGIPKLSASLTRLLSDCVLLVTLDFDKINVSAFVIIYTFVKNLREQLLPTLYCHRQFTQIDLEKFKADIIAKTSAKPQQSGSSTDPLSLYTTNFTALAKQGKIDAVLHRDKEIQQIMDILTRRRQNNPMLVGEAGVGKTAIVEGLALRIAEGNVPCSLRHMQLHSLDLASLQAGAGVQGEFEQRLKNLVTRVQQDGSVILFIDEAHNLIGAGGKQGHGDAANLLKPLLARGELRTIAATTWMEYKKHIENDAALTRRFEVVRVAEPNDEQAIGMLLSVVAKLEKHHNVFITTEAITAAVKLSRRYLPHRQLPDKAVALLDTACARVQLSQYNVPRAIYESQETILQLETQYAQLKRHELLGENCGAQLLLVQQQLQEEKIVIQKLEQHWQEEKKLFIELKMLREKILANPTSPENELYLEKQQYQTLLSNLKKIQTEQSSIAIQVDEEMIADVVSSLTGVPIGRLLSSELAITLSLTAALEKRILGQSFAIEALAKKLQTSRVNLQDPLKPQGVFLLVGNSGIGKTETAYAIADLLYGGPEFLTVINMSEFKEAHKISMLTGAPAGYVGYGEGGILTEAIRRRPFGVVLLDEIEKAHPSVQEIFYRVFDKGVLLDGQGAEIDCHHTVFLLTSNAGSQSLNNIDRHSHEWQEELQNELLTHFKPAFLARTTMLPYFNLNREHLMGISRLKLQRIIDRLQNEHQITLTFTENFLEQLSIAAENSIRNAREIDQQLEAHLLPLLSQYVLEFLLSQKDKKPTLLLDYNEKRGYILNT